MNTHDITFWISLVQAQYWHDPYDEESYALDCEFLSDINQELVFKPSYKERFSNISNFVLVKFEYDMMVEPKETEDLIGLQYLNKTERIHFLSYPGAHLQFSFEWFKSNIFPYINRTFDNVRSPLRL
uniref:Palmitoyl-protein thioesterase 1 n=1 Tax=Amphimedon queenslandica TaxID=400682 RepID=A0A1X7TN86_AMPQE